MKTVLALALGFWIGRQIYLNYDKQEALQKEARIKKRLKAFMRDSGLTISEAKEEVSKIVGEEE